MQLDDAVFIMVLSLRPCCYAILTFSCLATLLVVGMPDQLSEAWKTVSHLPWQDLSASDGTLTERKHGMLLQVLRSPQGLDAEPNVHSNHCTSTADLKPLLGVTEACTSLVS